MTQTRKVMRKMIRILAVALAIVMQINLEAHSQQQQPSQVVSVGGGTSTGGSYSQFSVIGGGVVQSIVSGGTYSGEVGFLYSTRVEYKIPVAMDGTVDLDENSANGNAVHTVVAIDSDSEVLSFDISAGNESGAFAINPSTGAITVADAAQLDYEKIQTFVLTAVVTDGANSDNATITVVLKNLNDNNPVVANATVSVDENSANGTTVHSIVASDADNDALSFSIISGNGNGAFAIDGTTGIITVADAAQLDYEMVTKFEVVVRVSDGLISADAVITINLNNLPDNKVVAQDQTIELDENSANGTSVHSVVATNPENGTLSYSIKAGNGSGAFVISQNTGAITVADASKLDYEVTRSFSLTVTVSDGVSSDDATIAVNLKNLNDNGPVAADGTAEVNENIAVGSLVHTVVGSDIDGNSLTFNITAGNEGGAFSVDSEGNLKVADAAKLDFETVKVFTLTVAVSDGLHTDEAAITVNLKNLNDNSPLAEDGSVELDENSGSGSAVFTLVATDADLDKLVYSIISGNGNGAFAIDASTGVITVANASQLDFEVVTEFVLLVGISDGTNTDEARVTVKLRNLDDIPRFIISGNVITPEGSSLVNGTIALLQDNNGAKVQVQSIVLNSEGKFQFQDVKEGFYTLKVVPAVNSQDPLPLLSTYLGGVQLPASAEVFRLNKDSDFPNIQVLRTQPVQEEWKGNSSISGILVEEEKSSGQGGRIMKGMHMAAGTPMADAQVFLTDPDTKAVRFSVQTDAEGKFTFNNIASRKYGFLVEYKGKSVEMPQEIDLSQPNATVEVTAVVSENGVEATVEKITAIEDEARGEVILYPNPLKDKLTLKLEDIAPGSLEVCVLDGQGKMLKRMQFEVVGRTFLKEVDFTGLPNGLYLISIIQSNSVIHVKALKH